MMTDLGLRAQVRVWTDSKAAEVIASRKGFWKTRHVQLKFLVAAGGDQLGKSGREESNIWRTI